jgi:KipI family sensor histidine kinase inhibitor
MNLPTFEPLADDALLLRFGVVIDAKHNARALEISRRLREGNPCWLRDAVPAYASLAVFFDCGSIDDADPHAFVAAELRAILQQTEAAAGAPARLVEIPVCYESALGPDLVSAANELGITADELIHRHSSVSYTVAMIGFAPGFPYLLGLPGSLALPRLPTPRTRVPAGSVAIGGHHTGIYPRESPGGWRLVGRTPLTLFDASRATPSLLMPGDRVRFQRIDAAVFERWPETP